MKAEAITPVVAARPGATVPCRVRVRNDGSAAAVYSVRVHGLGGPVETMRFDGDAVAPGETVDVEVPLRVPESFAHGDHAVAVEVQSDRRGDAPVLADVTVSIGALDRVVTTIVPSVIRNGRRARFVIEVVNRKNEQVELDLLGGGPDLHVAVREPHVSVAPGATRRVRAKVRGPRHVTGDPLMHVLTVEARGRSLPSYATASFHQRALMPRRLRTAVALLTVLALWATAAIVAVAWWSQRDAGETATETSVPATDADGDGLPDLQGPDVTTAGGGAAPGGGSSGGGSSGSSDGADGGSDGGGATDGAQAPSGAIVRGTVKAGGTGEDAGVLVTLTPTTPGLDQTDQTTTSGGSGGSPAALIGGGGFSRPLAIPAGAPAQDGTASTPTKFWPARSSTYDGSRLTGLRTISVQSKSSDADGAWLFSGVPLGQSYEVSFAKPGFGTQSFIVTPGPDGKPVELEVELEPGDGAISGVVAGPEGGLGGAEVAITDGTLTFRTTSSTDPSSPGVWSVGGLTTPATYTVTVSLHGFGTEVAQIRLDPGEELGGVRIAMAPGTGSVTGTVRGDGGPLGGVTLTASNADVTHTATSLTGGDVGAFSFPRLAIPGDWTITASAPGFITQSRAVMVDGAIGAVDFDLVRTTASLTGLVASRSADGTILPLSGAAISVRQDDLEVRLSSAVAPDAGAFNVGDLPPGSYVVTIGRYDHTIVSQLVALSAGQVLDLGQIVLDARQREQISPRGSVTVRVADKTGAGLTDVTVSLIDAGGHLATRSQSSGSESAVQFDQVPIGTYRIRLEKANYRPVVLENVSVGLGPIERNVTMYQYGTARGQVADGLAGSTPTFDHDGDSLTGPILTANRPLADYELVLYRKQSGSLVCIGTIGVGSGIVPDANGRIEWEVDTSMALLSGEYALRFSSSPGDTAPACAGRGRTPSGYAPSVDSTGAVAEFSIAANSDDKTLVPDIFVYPYPRVTGRLFIPDYDAGPPPAIDFVPLSSLSNLSVVLDCGGGRTAEAALSASGGVVSYEVPRSAIHEMFASSPIAGNGDLASCAVNASAGSDYLPTVAALASPLRVVFDGTTYADPIVNIALVDDPGIVQGTVFWTDKGADDTLGETLVYELTGVTVTGTGVTTGFGAGQSNDDDGEGPGPSPTVPPVAQTRTVSTTTGTGGFFSFPIDGSRQGIGTASYSFTLQNFQNSTPTAEVTADEGTWALTGSIPSGAVTESGGMLNVEMSPLAGDLGGNVQIWTWNPIDPALYDQVVVTATPPGEAPIQLPLEGDSRYAVDAAAAGTWELSFSSVPSSNLVTLSPAHPVRPFVAPEGSTEAPLATMVETGQVTVEMRDTEDSIVVPFDVASETYPQVHVTKDASGQTLPAWTDRTVVGDESGHAVVSRLPVDVANPFFGSITYHLSVEAPGYEVVPAEYRVYDATNDLLITSGVDATDIAVSVVTGTRLRVEVDLIKYGTIAGEVTGREDLAGTTSQLRIGEGLTVTAQRTDEPGDPITAVVDPDDADRFTLSGPPGTYDVTIAYPNYVTEVVSGVQIVSDDVTEVTEQLDLNTGRFRLRVIEDNVDPIDAVDVATVWLFDANDTDLDPADAVHTSTTDANGEIDLTGVYPGDYTVVIRKLDVSNNDLHFPVIASITMGRGATPNAAVVSKIALMPKVDGSITGTIVALNSLERPVQFPADVVVTRTFDGPELDPTGTTMTSVLDNEADEDDFNDPPADALTVTEADPTFTFTGVAHGIHAISFSDEDGFTTPPADDSVVVADSSGVDMGQIRYEAIARPVRVTVTNGADDEPVEGATVTLEIPSVTANGSPTEESDGEYVFTAVPPDLEEYTLTVEASLFEPFTTTVTIDPGDGEFAVPDVALTPLAEIVGVAQLKSSEAGTPMGGGTVRLLEDDGTTQVGSSVTVGTDGQFTFTLDTAGDYKIEISNAGYRTEVFDVDDLDLGDSRDVGSLVIEKYAAANVTVTPGGAASGVTMTVDVTPSDLPTPPVDGTAGVFSITELDPDATYSLTFEAPGYFDQTVTLSPDIGVTHGLNVPMVPLATFEGTVTNVDDGVTVYLCSGNVSGCDSSSDIDSVTIPSTGPFTFAFEALDVGDYTVRAIRADGQASDPYHFVVHSSGAITPADSEQLELPTTTTTTTTAPTTTEASTTTEEPTTTEAATTTEEPTTTE